MARTGRLLAQVLAGSWRQASAPLRLSQPELTRIAPLLIAQGEASLVWRRLRGTALAATPAAMSLREAARFHSLQASLDARALIDAVTALRAVGIEPLVAKGWAVARLYADVALRPSLDLDLYVPPAQLGAAARALGPQFSATTKIDLQYGFGELDDRGIDALYARSRLVPLESTAIRVLSEEDQLRHLCLHFLRHHGTQPLWLCDVAAALESRSAAFDWACCLSGSRRRAAWIITVLALAHHLLGADPAEIPGRHVMPDWLESGVLDQWAYGTTMLPSGSGRHSPLRLYHASTTLAHLWLNPLAAALAAGVSPARPPSGEVRWRYLSGNVLAYCRQWTPWREAPPPTVLPGHHHAPGRLRI